MRVGKFLVAAMLVLGVSSYARASITAAWVSVPITAPTDSVNNLTGFQSWDLVVTLSSADDWQAARVFMNQPATPNIFHAAAANGGNNTAASNFAPPNPFAIGAFPASQYTAFVSAPGPSTNPPGGPPASILGTTDGVNDFPPLPDVGGSNAMFDANHIAVTYGDTNTNLGVGGTIMRITFNGAVPTFQGIMLSLQNQTGIPIPQIGGGGPGPVTTPEPATLGIFALAGLFSLRRRA